MTAVPAAAAKQDGASRAAVGGPQGTPHAGWRRSCWAAEPRSETGSDPGAAALSRRPEPRPAPADPGTPHTCTVLCADFHITRGSDSTRIFLTRGKDTHTSRVQALLPPLTGFSQGPHARRAAAGALRRLQCGPAAGRRCLQMRRSSSRKRSGGREPVLARGSVRAGGAAGRPRPSQPHAWDCCVSAWVGGRREACMAAAEPQAGQCRTSCAGAPSPSDPRPREAVS